MEESDIPDVFKELLHACKRIEKRFQAVEESFEKQQRSQKYYDKDDDVDRHLGSIKLKIPAFTGRGDAEEYMEWERKCDHVFDCHNYSEEKKIKLAVVEFGEYVSIWWNQLKRRRKRDRKQPIETWDQMKKKMRKRFIPPYQQHLFSKLQTCSQGSNSVEDYSTFKPAKIVSDQEIKLEFDSGSSALDRFVAKFMANSSQGDDTVEDVSTCEKDTICDKIQEVEISNIVEVERSNDEVCSSMIAIESSSNQIENSASELVPELDHVEDTIDDVPMCEEIIKSESSDSEGECVDVDDPIQLNPLVFEETNNEHEKIEVSYPIVEIIEFVIPIIEDAKPMQLRSILNARDAEVQSMIHATVILKATDQHSRSNVFEGRGNDAGQPKEGEAGMGCNIPYVWTYKELRSLNGIQGSHGEVSRKIYT